MDIEALIRALGPASRERDGAIHIPPGRVEEMGRLVAADIERHMREMNPDAPADAPLCGGCILIAASEAASSLVRKHEPDAPPVPSGVIAELLDYAASHR